jgi:hypothetical protein
VNACDSCFNAAAEKHAGTKIALLRGFVPIRENVISMGPIRELGFRNYARASPKGKAAPLQVEL